MSSSVSDLNLVPTAVQIDDALIRVTFAGGRQVETPTSHYPWLQSASAQQRANWRVVGGENGSGDSLHWPDLDESIPVKTVLARSEAGLPLTPEGEELIDLQTLVRASNNAV